MINYKPSAQNHVAENLSKFAIYKDSCTSEYSELCDAGGIKSILDVTVNQQNNNESWISTVNMLSTSCNDIQAKLLYNWDDAAVCLFTRDNIRKAQDQENKKNERCERVPQKFDSSRCCKRIIPDQEALAWTSQHKILHRKRDENNQVILPSRRKPLVF